ncbi:MAG: anthranilate synthase component I [Desulfobulbaceae bacterium]|nr:anthranilate synthase component I [Desulfobulbaceae bacterium]
MYSPSPVDFFEMSAKCGLIPVHRTIIADLDTPLTIYAKVANGEKHAFLFESMEGGEKWGRYSFIGTDPMAVITSDGNELTIMESDSQCAEVRKGVNPLDEMREYLSSFEAQCVDGLPRFYGGAVGYLGYDMVRHVEDIPDRHSSLGLPDSSFMIPRMVLVYDAVRQCVTVVCNVKIGPDVDAVKEYELATKRIDELITLIRKPLPKDFAVHASGCAPHEFKSNMDETSFSAMVERAKEYILSGDIIQVVVSQRFQTTTSLDPFTLYRALRHINPSPYLFFLRQGDVVLIGSSPEILVRVEDGEIELRPIAGTRKRGCSEAEDLALEKELLADPKERAEHLMLVDLGRNDVGRVAANGTVTVKDLLVVERYSHVMHIVSGVEGKLREGKDQFDVFKACFPAGTVSGAAKIRAMEVIDELEVQKRGPYAGAVGYFGFSGNMDFCITIRTFVMKGPDLWVQAGAGIVSDSVPQKEYEETINKAMGLRRAVELAEEGF